MSDHMAFNDRTLLDSIEQRVFDNTHAAIQAILQVAPLAGKTALLQVSK